MSKLIFIPFIIFSLGVLSQEIDSTEEVSYPRHIGKNEITYMFLVVNARSSLFQSDNFSPVYEFLTEIRYRHRFDAVSLRIHFAYFNRSYNEEHPTAGAIEEVRAGSGIQYNPLKRNELIYFYLDAGYRWRKEGMRLSKTSPWNSIPYRRTEINAFDMTGGVGTKIRIFGGLHFTADFGYNFFSGKGVSETVLDPLVKPPSVTSPYSFATPTAKVGLSFTFQ